MTPVRLEPAAPQSRVQHSTTEPLRSLFDNDHFINFHRSKNNEPAPLAHGNFWCFFINFNGLCSGNCYCFKLQIQIQITYCMVQCMPFGWRNAKYCFYRKVHNFQMVIILSRTSQTVTNRFQTNIKRLKMCSSNTFYVSASLK